LVQYHHNPVMDDYNDLVFFEAVVRHNGFSAAARATGIEKTRLSRRVAELEQRLGVRLLHRSTRRLALTEAGERFYSRCAPAVESAQAAFDSVAELRAEPAGTVRLCCPVVMAQSYLAAILPSYLALHPKVKVFVEATDRRVNLIEERFDLALRAATRVEDTGGLVAQNLGSARRILVASAAFFGKGSLPTHPSELEALETLSEINALHSDHAQGELIHDGGEGVLVNLAPRLVSSDLRVQLEAAVHGLGIALLPEPITSLALEQGQLIHVLPHWSAQAHLIHLLYPRPRGMLPSVRSLIDHLKIHMPARIQQSRPGNETP
jgi:DNA-binding transcriptional LysR family regulator